MVGPGDRRVAALRRPFEHLVAGGGGAHSRCKTSPGRRPGATSAWQAGVRVDGFLEIASGASALQVAAVTTWLLLQGCVLPSVPEEILIASLGMLVGQGRIAPALAFAAVLAGLLPANAFALLLGTLGRRGARPGGRIARLLGAPAVARALETVRRHGPVVVVATRFLPLVRGPVYLAAGLSGLGLRRFVLLDAAAACVQVPLLLWLGARLGQDASLEVALQRLGWLAAGLGAAALLVAAGRRAAPSVRASSSLRTEA